MAAALICVRKLEDMNIRDLQCKLNYNMQHLEIAHYIILTKKTTFKSANKKYLNENN